MFMNDIKRLAEYILEQAKKGEAIHTVEQGIRDKLLTLGEQALGQFIVLHGDPAPITKYTIFLSATGLENCCLNGSGQSIPTFPNRYYLSELITHE